MKNVLVTAKRMIIIALAVVMILGSSFFGGLLLWGISVYLFGYSNPWIYISVCLLLGLIIIYIAYPYDI